MAQSQNVLQSFLTRNTGYASTNIDLDSLTSSNGSSGEDCMEYPMIYVVTSNRTSIPDCNKNLFRGSSMDAETLQHPQCMLKNKFCGSEQPGTKPLIFGNMCEIHSKYHKNFVMRNVLDKNELKYLPVAYDTPEMSGIVPVGFLWAALPLYSTKEQILQILNNGPVKNVPDRDNLATIISFGTHTISKPGVTNDEKIMMAEFINWGKRSQAAWKEIANCWERNLLIAHFSDEYMEKNKKNKFLNSLSKIDEFKIGDFKTSTNGKEKKYTTYTIPYSFLCYPDLETVAMFTPSQLFHGDLPEDSSVHVPNLQIFDGIIYTNTGFGVKGIMGDKKFRLEQKYSEDIMQIVSQKSLHGNASCLFIEAMCTIDVKPIKPLIMNNDMKNSALNKVELEILFASNNK